MLQPDAHDLPLTLEVLTLTQFLQQMDASGRMSAKAEQRRVRHTSDSQDSLVTELQCTASSSSSLA